jgi:hypothetical protein
MNSLEMFDSTCIGPNSEENFDKTGRLRLGTFCSIWLVYHFAGLSSYDEKPDKKPGEPGHVTSAHQILGTFKSINEYDSHTVTPSCYLRILNQLARSAPV